MMTVRLIAHTPEPEKVVAAAAKLCYSDAHITDLLDGLDEEKTARFLTMLSDLGHASPIEHASFTFGIEGVSRSLLAQLTRHRIASFSVQSQRYVAETMFEYVVPPQIADIPEAADEFRRAMEEDQRHYESLTARLKEKHLADKLAAGMGEKDAPTAFRAAHTLKGVCQNLGFDALYAPSSALTEALRGGSLDGADELFPPVEKEYQRVVEALKELD